MQIKVKNLLLSFIAIFVFIMIIFAYYRMYEIQSSNQSSIRYWKSSVSTLKYSSAVQEDYLFRQYLFESKVPLSQIQIDNKHNLLQDTIFIILIPKNVCSVCVEDLLSKVDKYLDVSKNVLILYEEDNNKNINILRNRSRTEKFDIAGYSKKEAFLSFDTDYPICFVLYNDRAEFTFIHLSDLGSRTIKYLKLINKLL